MKYFNIHEGRVYYHKHSGGNSLYLLKQADAKTFKELNHFWGVDAKSVFGQTKKVTAADRASFKVLNALFAKDKNQVFGTHGPLVGADLKTFKVLDSGERMNDGEIEYVGYARDKNNIYFHDFMWGKAKAIKADAKTFRTLSHSFACDAKACYCRGTKLKKADPNTFVVLGLSYARDHERAYWEFDEFDCDDVESLRDLGYDYATDGRQVYLNAQVVERADPKTFQPFFSNLGRDAKRLFHHYDAVNEKKGNLELTLWRPREMLTFLCNVYGKGAKITVDGKPFAASKTTIDALCERCEKASAMWPDGDGQLVDRDEDAQEGALPKIQIQRKGKAILTGPDARASFLAPLTEWRAFVEPCVKRWCAWYPQR